MIRTIPTLALAATLALATLPGLASGKFPPNFAFGTATAAYQVEGAVKEGGRGDSIWDDFSHNSGKVYNNDTGDVADDHYHRYQTDIGLMQKMGLKHYRLSLAWPRIIPDGDGNVSADGIAFYTNLFQALQHANIEPFVTLYHWDLPSALMKKYNAWLDPSRQITEAFANYSRVCFQHFGPYVKHWLTFNEPLSFIGGGYQYGSDAPGRCSDRSRCPAGDSSTEPYLAGHNVLLAHAKAVKIYREEFQKVQQGSIGITTSCDWQEPLDPSSVADQQASERALEWECGWWQDPVYFGDYPQTMKDRLGSRLPSFTDSEKQMLKGSHDFFGLNHYSSRYVTVEANCPTTPQTSWAAEACVSMRSDRNGVPIGPAAASNWLLVVPWGIRKIVHWVWARYHDAIFITENGVDEDNLSPQPPILDDQWRISFYEQYLSNVSAAIDDGADVRGYFAWSLMDNFEWGNGYSKRFGLHYVDYATLQRIPKASVQWFANFIKENNL